MRSVQRLWIYYITRQVFSFLVLRQNVAFLCSCRALMVCVCVCGHQVVFVLMVVGCCCCCCCCWSFDVDKQSGSLCLHSPHEELGDRAQRHNMDLFLFVCLLLLHTCIHILISAVTIWPCLGFRQLGVGMTGEMRRRRRGGEGGNSWIAELVVEAGAVMQQDFTGCDRGQWKRKGWGAWNWHLMGCISAGVSHAF